MKKVLLCSFAVVLAAGTYLLASDNTDRISFLSANVEALASGESGGLLAEVLNLKLPEIVSRRIR